MADKSVAETTRFTVRVEGSIPDAYEIEAQDEGAAIEEALQRVLDTINFRIDAGEET